jgi:hypothetical protein
MTGNLTGTEVINFYERLPIRSDAAALDLSNDVIACTGELSEVAQALGADLGRPVVGVRASDHWLQMARPPSSVLLFAGRHEFSAESARIWVASSLRFNVPLGFLLVDDPGQARFQATKLRLAHTRALPGDDAIIDSINGLCGEPGKLVAARPERVSTVLTSPWRLLAIGGHSDMGHMGLGSQLLCGATGPEHFAGRLLADGCDPDNDICRCTRKFLSTATPARSLRASVVALMGCRTFDATTAEGSTTNSLCASALSGLPVAVIAMLGDLDDRFDGVGQCARSLADGRSVGAAVQHLSRSHRVPTAHGMALAGDPALRFAPDATRASAAPPAYVAADCRDRARPLLDRCYETISRSGAADHIRRSLLKVSDRSMDPDIEDVLEALDRACEHVQDAAWTAVELLHEAVGYQRWRAPDRVLERLEQAIERWDAACIEVCGLVPGNDMYNALHAFRRVDAVSTEGSCPRCGSQLATTRYSDPSRADPQRIAVSCWQCGPIQESAHPGPALAITVSGIHEPGGTMRPRLSVRAAPDEQKRPGRLAVVLQDRLTDQHLAVFRAQCTLATLPEVSMIIPAESRSDLHFLWAVWVSEMTAAFAQTRTPVIRPIH